MDGVRESGEGVSPSPSLSQPLLSPSDYAHRLRCAAEVVQAAILRSFPPHPPPFPAMVAVVLGSGLSEFSSRLTSTLSLPYSSIPYMPQPAVSGHQGELRIGRLPHPDHLHTSTSTTSTTSSHSSSTTTTITTTTITTDHAAARSSISSLSSSSASSLPSPTSPPPPLVLCFSGRVHSYEGHLSVSVCFISRLCHLLGVTCLVLTNSAGGAGAGMVEGSIVLMTDHLRACALEPLTPCLMDGEGRLGDGCVDALTSPHLYPASLHAVARASAVSAGVRLHEGVYHWSCGPCYETWAEVRAGISLGTAAFGMSTVPEALAAAALRLPTLCLSLCTNLAAGLTSETLTHEAVKAVAQAAGPRFQHLLHHTLHNASQRALTPTLTTPTTSSTAPPPTALSGASVDLHLRVGWCPSLGEVQATAAAVHLANSPHPPPRVAIILVGSGSVAGQWSDIRHLPLSSLPGLPSPPLSRSACCGSLRLASCEGVRCALVEGVAGEGFTAAESAWLAMVLAMVGVTRLLQCGEAVRCSAASAADPPLLLLNDLLDRSMEAWPPLCLSPSSPPSASSSALFAPALSSWLSVSSPTSASAVRRGCVGFFAGPSWPSGAEQRMAAAAGCTAVATSSPALLVYASHLGLHTAALFALHRSAQEAAAASTSTSRTHPIALRLLSYDQPPPDTQPQQLRHVLGCPPHPFGPAQEKWEEVGEAAARLRSAVSTVDPPSSSPSALPLPRALLLCHPLLLPCPPASLTILWQAPCAALLPSLVTSSSTHLSMPSPSPIDWTVHIGVWAGPLMTLTLPFSQAASPRRSPPC